MIKKVIVFLLVSFFLSIPSHAQYYSSGSDPANIRWHQIKTDHFKVVFPEEYEKEARRLTAIFETIYFYGGYSLGHNPKRIDVLVHSRSAYSNGFVSWAPKRIELYPSSNQDIFAQDYLAQLAIHEFRHVVQIDKLNAGFTKALSYIFGQQAVGGVLGAYIPMWFLEGDAVMTETMLSNSGRGRQPSFEQEMRAQLLEKRLYSYDKAGLGSYRDYVPNHYIMGYHLVAGARSKYGKDVWEKALNYSGKRSWCITPFNHGIKEVTGLNKTDLYKNTFSDRKAAWIEKDSSTVFSKFNYYTPRDPSYKNYLYPKFLNDSTIIAQISGPGEITQFVTIDTNTNKEKRLYIPGHHERAPFSIADNKLVWVELEPNLRWENGDWSNIWIYDLKNSVAKRLTHKKRYYAPAISPDGKRIATVHISKSGRTNILFIDTKSGETIDTLSTPGNQLPLTPVWTPDGIKLVTIILTPEGKQIEYYDIEDRTWHTVTKPTYSDIRHPYATNSNLYFSGSWSGIENIYRVNFSSKKVEQVTSSRFGGTGAALNSTQEKLILSDYSSDGYRLAYINSDNITPKKTIFQQPAPQNSFLDNPLNEEKGLPQLSSLTGDTLDVKRYSKWNLFNFHSWAPAFVDVNNMDINYGASLLSQNLLGNTFTTLGYNADNQYTREKFYFNFIYNGWFPKLNFQVKYGNDDAYYGSSTPTDTFIVESTRKQQFLEMNFDINIPLNISRGAWSRRIEPSIGVSYIKAFDYEARKSYITQKDGKWYYTGAEQYITAEGYNINTIDWGLFLYNIQKRSQRDVTSRWGQVLQFKYRHSPYGDYDFGSLTGVHSRIYLPGFFKHHAIRIDNDWQKKLRGDYSGDNSEGYRTQYGFPDFIKFPRGYTAKYNDELYVLKNDYILPVWNPDINIGGLAYFKRIIMNLFYDYSKASYKIQNSSNQAWFYSKKRYQSTGAEVRTTVHLLRFVFPFEFGYRYAYRLSDNKSYHEFLFSMNFAGYVVNGR